MFEGNEIVVTHENKEQLQGRETYALVMVKPHAMGEAAGTVITDLFDGGYEKHLPFLNLSENTKKVLADVKLLGTVYRDLRDERYKRVLDILYEKEEGKPRLPIIKDEYTGPCQFLILSSSFSTDVFYDGLQELKGKERLLDEKGNVVNSGSGVRGAMIMPRKMLDLNNLSEADIRVIASNVIHITDQENETAKVIRVLLPPAEVDRLGENASGFKKFMNKNAPVSII